MIIYPAIDIKDGKCVRLKQGLASQKTIYFEDPLDAAKSFVDANASWIHIVDLDGAFVGTPKNLKKIEQIASLGKNIELGGGLRTIQNVQDAINAGVQRAIIGTKACENEDFLGELVQKFGDKIALGIDAKDGFVAVKGWVSLSDKKALDLAKDAYFKSGVKTVIYTDISTDGMLTGPNIQAQEQMLKTCPINVIASGGVSSLEDILNLKKLGEKYSNFDGVIVGKAIYEKRVNLEEILKEQTL